MGRLERQEVKMMLEQLGLEELPVDPITMDKIRKPYQLPCCRQLCEREALGKWMASSKYFRHRCDGHLERVAACPLCRTMLNSTDVPQLAQWFSAPIDPIHAWSVSDLADPAFPTSAKQQNFLLLKTRDELNLSMMMSMTLGAAR